LGENGQPCGGAGEDDQPALPAAAVIVPEHQERQGGERDQEGIGGGEVGSAAEGDRAGEDEAGEHGGALAEGLPAELVGGEERKQGGQGRGETSGKLVDAEEAIRGDLEPVEESGLVFAQVVVEGGDD